MKLFFHIYDLTKTKTFKQQHNILINDYQKSIDWPCRTKSVQGIFYKWLIQILLSAIPFISMVLTVIVIVISQSNLSHHVGPPLLFVNVYVGVYSENFF